MRDVTDLHGATVLLKKALRALFYPSTLFGGEDPFYMPTFLRRDSKATDVSAATQGALTALVKMFGLLWLVIIIMGIVGWIAEKIGHPLF